MSERSRETSSTSTWARSRLLQKSEADIRSSRAANWPSSFATSKKPPQFADARLQIFCANFLNVGSHARKITILLGRASRALLPFRLRFETKNRFAFLHQ